MEVEHITWGSWFLLHGHFCFFRPMVCGLKKRGGLEEGISTFRNAALHISPWRRQFDSVVESQLPYPSRTILEVPR